MNNLPNLTDQEIRAAILRSLLNVESSKLGTVLQEYILESDHAGWSGVPDSEVSATYRMLDDLLLYLDNKD